MLVARLSDGAGVGELLVFGLGMYVVYRIRMWHFRRREEVLLEYDVPEELLPNRLEDR